MDHDTVTLFVQDAIAELEQRNARDVVEYLRMMLECDGPDVDGAVSSLVAYGAVTVAWIERLAAINEKSAGFFDEELAELREGLSGAKAHFTPKRSARNAHKPRASNGSPGWDVWRWGESNPRPAAGPEFFSERSLRFYFSAPGIA